MKKLFIFFCLLSILNVNCSVSRNVNSNQGFNSNIHGELYIEENAGFSMYIPKRWEIRKNINYEYSMIIGPIENNYLPNIIFLDASYSGSIPSLLNDTIVSLRQEQGVSNFNVLERGTLETFQGILVNYVAVQSIRVDGINRLQRLYMLPNKNGNIVMLITCTIPPSSNNRYNTVLDECVETFNWTR